MRLRRGQSITAGSGYLLVGFDAVLADSRCPKGDTCIWAGDATVRIWVQKPGGPRQQLELHTATAKRRWAATGDGYVLLQVLEPYPIAGQRLDPDGYIATLLLTREQPESDGLR
ncbi:MAG: hypothetical protein U1F35_15405 [Steroidobacteraceae bacterium]